MALFDKINELAGFGLRWYRTLMLYRLREHLALSMHRAARDARPKLQAAGSALTIWMAIVASLAVNALAMFWAGAVWLLALVFEDAGPWIGAIGLLVGGVLMAAVLLLLIFIVVSVAARKAQLAVDEVALRIHPQGPGAS